MHLKSNLFLLRMKRTSFCIFCSNINFYGLVLGNILTLKNFTYPIDLTSDIIFVSVPYRETPKLYEIVEEEVNQLLAIA